jgi:hypothetical protein
MKHFSTSNAKINNYQIRFDTSHIRNNLEKKLSSKMFNQKIQLLITPQKQ